MGAEPATGGAKGPTENSEGHRTNKHRAFAEKCPPVVRVKPVVLRRLRPLTGQLAWALLRVGLVSSLSAPMPRPAPPSAPLPGHHCSYPATGAAAAATAAPAARWYRGQRCPDDVPSAHARAAWARATRARGAHAHAEPPTARSHCL